MSSNSNYTIYEPLGRGGQGVVYRAYNETLRIEVALKYVTRSRIRESQEAHRLALVRHPNVVEVKDAWISGHEIEASGGPHLYIVMELLRGVPLSRVLRAGMKLSLGQALHLAISILRALIAIHDKGILHCDLTPSNIFLVSELPPEDLKPLVESIPLVKILDFGLAVTKAPSNQLPYAFGTEGYMSPEQLQRQELTHRTDLFQLARIIEDSLGEELEGDLVHVVWKARAERYGSARDMLRELAAVVPPANQLRDACQLLNLPFIFDKATTKGGYRRENIVVNLNEQIRAVPDHLQAQYDQERSKVSSISTIWNGTQLALTHALTKRNGPKEEPKIILSYSKNDYFHAITMRNIFDSLNPIDHKRMQSTTELTRFADPPFYTSCGVHIGIITSDSYLIFLKRSTSVSQSESAFTCGPAKGMTEADIGGPANLPCPFRAAVRALDQGLSISLADPEKEEEMESAIASVHLMGLVCKQQELQWGFVGYVDLREPQIPERCRYSHVAIQQKFLAHLPEDSWKLAQVHAVPFEVDHVLSFLRSHRDAMPPSTTACALLLLFDYFPEGAILSSLLHG